MKLAITVLHAFAVLAVTCPHASGETFQSDGVEIHYSTAGPADGKVVVLLHGWFSKGGDALASPLGVTR